MNWQSLKSTVYNFQGQEAFPVADQCPKCNYFFLTANVLRIIRERNDRRVTPRVAQCQCEATEQRRQDRFRAMARAANLPQGSPRHFETFQARNGTAAAAAAAKLFVGGSAQWHILVLSGSPGTGKSHLVEAVLRRALELENSVRYEYVPHLLNELRATMDDDSVIKASEIRDMLNSVNILALDDIGAQKATPWATEQLTTLVDNRIRSGQRLIVATNQSDVEMADFVGERIADRLFDESGSVKIVALTCPSYRTSP